MSRIKIRKYRISLPSKTERPSSPIRIVMIGDMHNRMFGEGNQDLVDKIVGLYPDLVCSVGDLSVVKPGLDVKPEPGIALLKRLSCECPVYCILGNHEHRTKEDREGYPGVYERLKKALHAPNITLLENERIETEVKGSRLFIYGYELPLKYYKKRSKEYVSRDEIREAIGEPAEGEYNILLAHNPVHFESYAQWGADLTMSGHLHGGTVRIPFAGGVVSPQLKLFPKYDCGLFMKYGRKMVVTAGLGTHSMVMRINNPAEISLIELY